MINMITEQHHTKQTESCFIAKLGHYADLSRHDREILATFEKNERRFTPGAPIVLAGRKAENVYVIKEGWVVSYTVLPDGRRQNIRVYLPGDVMGLSGLAFEQTTIHVEAITKTVLCPFPKKRMATLFEESPRLTALFFTLAMRDMVVLRDKIGMLGRMQTEARLAFFLLEMQARLRIGSTNSGDRFRLPMSQTMIADVIGASFVSVNRALRDMDRAGTITRHGKEIEILAWQTLADRCDFQDRYHALDTAWFPEG